MKRKTKTRRNDPCPCGSGKKYKKCHGAPESPTPDPRVPEKAVAGFMDHEKGAFVWMTRDMVLNQLRREGPKIAESFDNAFDAQLREISEEFAKTFALLSFGYKNCVGKKDERLRCVCAELLVNAAYTLMGALELLRHGFRLQPGILIRSEIETICVALSLFSKPGLLKEYEKGELDSTKMVGPAKKVLPFLGHLYGHFSEEFAHLGRLHRMLHSWDVFSPDDQAGVVNLRFIKLGLNLLMISAELVFPNFTTIHRYWKELAPQTYAYNPSHEERKWQETFLEIKEAPAGGK